MTPVIVSGQMSHDDVAPFADIVHSDMIASFDVDDVRLLTLLGVNWVPLANRDGRYRWSWYCELHPDRHSHSIDLIYACLEHRLDIARVVIDNADSLQSLVAVKSDGALNPLEMLTYWNRDFDEKLALAKMIVAASDDSAAHLIVDETSVWDVLKRELVNGDDNVTRLYLDQLAREGRDLIRTDPYGRAILEYGIQMSRPEYLNILKFAPDAGAFLNRRDSHKRTALEHANFMVTHCKRHQGARVDHSVAIRNRIASYFATSASRCSKSFPEVGVIRCAVQQVTTMTQEFLLELRFFSFENTQKIAQKQTKINRNFGYLNSII